MKLRERINNKTKDIESSIVSQKNMQQIFIKDTEDDMSDEEFNNYCIFWEHYQTAYTLSYIIGIDIEINEELSAKEVEYNNLQINLMLHRDFRYKYEPVYTEGNLIIKYNKGVVLDENKRFIIRGEWKNEITELYRNVLYGNFPIPPKRTHLLEELKHSSQTGRLTRVNLKHDDNDVEYLIAKRYLRKNNR